MNKVRLRLLSRMLQQKEKKPTIFENAKLIRLLGETVKTPTHIQKNHLRFCFHIIKGQSSEIHCYLYLGLMPHYSSGTNLQLIVMNKLSTCLFVYFQASLDPVVLLFLLMVTFNIQVAVSAGDILCMFCICKISIVITNLKTRMSCITAQIQTSGIYTL